MSLEYVRSYDFAADAWKTRGDAADFAAFLAGELKFAPKAIVVDKDGKNYRVLLPIIAAYWSPAKLDEWEAHFRQLILRVKNWASS